MTKTIYITETQSKQLLNERMSANVYHFTHGDTLYRILKEGAIRLETKMAARAEDTQGNKLFYLSLTRSKDARQGYSNGKPVRIEFDGDALNNDFSGKAISYWGARMGKNAYMNHSINDGRFDDKIPSVQSGTENEDRLFTNRPLIRNIERYIKRIDILVNKYTDEHEAASLAAMAEANYHIPTFIYTNKDDYVLQTNNCEDGYELLQNKYSYEYNLTNFAKSGASSINFIETKNLLRHVFDIICYAEFDYDDSKMRSYIANTLRTNNLERFVKHVMAGVSKDMKETYFYPNPISDLSNWLGYLRRSSVRDSEVYNAVMKLFASYCKKIGVNSMNGLIEYKQKLRQRKYEERMANVSYSQVNESIMIDPNKTRVVAKYLDDNFIKGAIPTIDDNGYSSKMSIVAMKGFDGQPIKYMTDKQLFYLLQDKFQHIMSDESERDKFLKHVMVDWYEGKVGRYGLTSKNMLNEEDSGNEKENIPITRLYLDNGQIIDIYKRHHADDRMNNRNISKDEIVETIRLALKNIMSLIRKGKVFMKRGIQVAISGKNVVNIVNRSNLVFCSCFIFTEGYGKIGITVLTTFRDEGKTDPEMSLLNVHNPKPIARFEVGEAGAAWADRQWVLANYGKDSAITIPYTNYLSSAKRKAKRLENMKRKQSEESNDDKPKKMTPTEWRDKSIDRTWSDYDKLRRKLTRKDRENMEREYNEYLDYLKHNSDNNKGNT